jgi:hypothetical protein
MLPKQQAKRSDQFWASKSHIVSPEMMIGKITNKCDYLLHWWDGMKKIYMYSKYCKFYKSHVKLGDFTVPK